MNPSSSTGGDDQGQSSSGGNQAINGGDSVNSSEDGGGESRKRKTPSEAPTAAEEAATATLMSLPGKLFHKKEPSETSSKDRSDPDVDLSTIEGQQALNPKMSIEEARFQAKREYNRLNAARARIRNKEMLEDLHGKVATLTKRAEDLERENEILRAQVKVLTAQQQTQQAQQRQQQQQQLQQQQQAPPQVPNNFPPQQQQSTAPQQQQAKPTESTNQAPAPPRSHPETLAVSLLNVLQGGGGGSAAASSAPMSLQSNSQSSLPNMQGNPLAQLFPALQGIAANARPAAPTISAPNPVNPLEGLSQLLKTLQAQQQQQPPAQQQHSLQQQAANNFLPQRMQQQSQPPQQQQQQPQQQPQQPPTDLQSMLRLLAGNMAATPTAPAPPPPPPPAPPAASPTPSPALPAALAAFGQSAGINENVLREFFAQQQKQQNQQQQRQQPQVQQAPTQQQPPQQQQQQQRSQVQQSLPQQQQQQQQQQVQRPQQQQLLQPQGPPGNPSALLNSLTGQASNSNTGSGSNTQLPSSLVELLSKADPVTRQNLLQNVLQGNQNFGHNLFAQLHQSSNGMNPLQQQQQQQQQNASPALQSVRTNDSGSLSGRGSQMPGSQTGTSDKNKNDGYNSGTDCKVAQVGMIPNRDQLNQLLPTLSPKTLYSILKSNPDSHQQGEQSGDTEASTASV